MCHHPYGDINAKNDKFAKWRSHDDGSWLLCGHVHTKWKTIHHMINVGVDVWNFQPVSIVEILGIIHKSDGIKASPE